jgi:hypothetical protein
MSSIKVKENKITSKLVPLDNQLGNDDNIFPHRTGLLYLVIGRKGSGKTTVLLNLLKTKKEDGGYRGFYDNIFLINPNGKDPKYSKLIEELEKSGNYYTEMTNDVLEEIEEKIRTFNDNYDGPGKPANLLICDDCIHFLPKSNQKARVFHGIITGMRHLHLNMIITLQKLKGANTIVRSNADIVSVWRNDTKTEVKDIQEEFGFPAEYLEEAWKDKHGFATVSFASGKPRYFIKFNEIEK